MRMEGWDEERGRGRRNERRDRREGRGRNRRIGRREEYSIRYSI